jgi:tetratricopeptide (TPR) repeat protein
MRLLANKSLNTSVKIEALSYSLILMMAMLSTSVIPAKADASQVELQRGIQSFNSKHYSDAVGHLQQYIAAAPHESIGHYYLANCLYNLGYEKPCMDEYARALKESTSQKMTDYCRDAIRSMQSSKLATATGTAPARAIQSSGSNQPNVPLAAFPPSMAESYVRPDDFNLPRTGFARPGMTMLRFPISLSSTQPVSAYTIETGGVPDLALEKTLVRMSDQSNVEIATLQKNLAADLESLKQHLADDIFKLNKERDARIQALLDGVRVKGSSSSDTVDSIGKDIASKTDMARRTCESTTQAREQEYLEQIAKLQHDLRASQNQVADARRVPGNHPNLQLAGTDLYTRNFIPSPNPPPPDELVATPERLIVDAHSHPGRTVSRVVRDPAEAPPPPPGRDLRVRGQLIK